MSLLRPGLHVARRDDRHLQIGLDPPWRVVLPEDPDVRRVLGDLQAGRWPTPTTPAGHRALAELQEAGLLAAPGEPAGRVLLLGPEDRVVDARRLLTTAPGVEVVASPADVDVEVDVALAISAGEPDRVAIDELVRRDRPHLVVAAGPGGHRIGPFVVPGSTACLRCVDAHLGEADPRRAVVVEQLAGRRLGPEDLPLDALATAWAVRDVLDYLTGDEPTTWSATVEIGPSPLPAHRRWARHPYCGCSWAQPSAETPGHAAS